MKKATTFEAHLERQFKDPAFRRGWIKQTRAELQAADKLAEAVRVLRDEVKLMTEADDYEIDPDSSTLLVFKALNAYEKVRGK